MLTSRRPFFSTFTTKLYLHSETHIAYKFNTLYTQRTAFSEGNLCLCVEIVMRVSDPVFLHSTSWLLNLSFREQPMLPVLDVFTCSAWAGSEYALLKARQQKCAEDDLRHIILQLNTKGFTASKITVIVTYKNKAVIIVLQETHCTTADKLVIPSF